MNSEPLNIRRKIFHFILFSWALMTELLRVLTRYFKLALLYQKTHIIKALAEAQTVQPNSPKVIVTIAHVTSVEEAKDRGKASIKIERLKNTIDGLLSSFAHCQLSVVINTVPDRHITAYLPEYQIPCIRVQEESDCDPMFVGFRAQDELVNNVENFDWFLFIEDDIVLHDSFILEKLGKFNTKSGYDHAVLLPNRYEFWQGTKSYIDLTILESDNIWNGLSTVEIEGVKFAECANPHAGFYCLSKSQLQHLISSGRAWKDKNLGFGGPRECAATYNLLECFSLYKPHPSNLYFFEVKHYDQKYSQLYPEPSAYSFSSIKNLSKLS
jgi:hypothetical protein